jgi:hypothetical protein
MRRLKLNTYRGKVRTKETLQALHFYGTRPGGGFVLKRRVDYAQEEGIKATGTGIKEKE